MSDAPKSSKWRTALSLLVGIAALVAYAWLSIAAEEREREQEQGDRIREEVAESVGQALEAGRLEREAKMREAMKRIAAGTYEGGVKAKAADAGATALGE